MPWREKNRMKLREEFVLRALEPDANMAALCREYTISRKTGYKWLKRFREAGIVGLADLSRRPHSSPLRVSGELVLRILELRIAHPRWGPRKLRAVLARTLEADDVPSIRTIARILERAGMVRKRGRRRTTTEVSRPDIPEATRPNELWTADFKGWWRTADGVRAEPLTIRDAHSRFVLVAELMETTKGSAVREVFEKLFERRGLPRAILVDNGSPFACTRSPGGLTTLSAWWVSLGIRLHRSRPGHPQDNGGHERMHLDMRFDVEDAPADDIPAQRIALIRWQMTFNFIRPHEALDMKTPAELVRPSPRRLTGSRRCWYAPDREVRRVNNKGYIKYLGQARYIGQALVGRTIGLRRIDEDTAHILYYDMDLGTLALAS